MKEFAELINALDSTNKTNQKLVAINTFLTNAADQDKLWLLALFTGKRPKRSINTTLLRSWILEISNIPEWLFIECYGSVGDLGETIALLLPNESNEISVDKSLSSWMEEILQLNSYSLDEKKEYVLHAWKSLNPMERFIFNKLIGGSFRIGVSNKMMINAIAKFYNLDASAVAHSVMGDWDINAVAFEELIKGAYVNTNHSQPYPFCLAYPIESDIYDLGNINDWQIEYKWDGIRGQLIKRNNEIFIWSRGEELVTSQFPELVNMMESFPYDVVLDGEIIVMINGEVQPFATLQKRLNRKSITKKMIEELPISLIVYDILEYKGEDLRKNPLSERRDILENVMADFTFKNKAHDIVLSTTIKANEWDELRVIREDARIINSEGLMLKSKNSMYHSGRKRGDWWKWKVDPLTIDAVLIYAQKGSGRRSAFYTDFTFAVKSDDKLVTIAKAYSGLTNAEIQEVSKFVNKNAIETFGPVRTVKPELVFEIGFEGISYSNRHKSGVALRFPRIIRWRKDKSVADIDDIEEIKKMIVS